MLEPALLALAIALGAEEEAAVPSLDDYQFAQVQRAGVSDGRTKISVETNAPTPAAGTFPVRVFIDNTLGPAGAVELVFRANAQGSHSIKRTVQLRAEERRSLTLPASADMRYGTVTASGAGTRPGSASVYFQSTSAPNKVVLCLGKPEAYERFAGKAPNYTAAAVQVYPVPPEEAFTELASYAGYDAVIVPEVGTLEALAEAQVRALEAYAATGGALMIQGPLRSTRTLPLLTATGEGRHPYAFGVVTIREGGALDPLAMRPELAVNPRGPVPDYERRYGGAHPEALLPQATAPLGKFLLIIMAFTLLIGPGSIFVARRRGPAALLVTIPFTAFVTCAAIIGYSLAADGFTVHEAAYGLTFLDQRAHRAISLGVIGYYANLAPPGASYGAMTVLIPPHEERREHFGADMSWSEGLTMGSDFIPSRLYREWGLLTIEPTRARLVVKRQGEAFVVQNALGHDLTSVSLNVDGVRFKAGPTREGGEQALVRDEALPTFAKADRFASAVLPKPAALRPGQFLAQLTGDGFLPGGGITTQLHEGQHWVIGAFEP